MSNAAKLAIPVAANNGHGYIYNSATDQFDLVDVATQAEVGAAPVGGDLTGTVANAQIAANAVGTAELAANAVTVAKIGATGTPGATTFLRGDATWSVPAGGGGGGAADVLVDHAVPTGTTETVDLTAGNVHRVRWDANVTFTFTGAAAGWSKFQLLFYHDTSSTDYTVAWPASVKWDGGLNPFLGNSNVANGVATFEFWSHDGGTTFYGHHGGTFGI